MNIIQVLNADGEKVEINLNEIGVNTYCIACGWIPKEAGHLKVFEVGNTDCLKSWLKYRGHYAEADDNVLLCESCQEEAMC